MGITPRLMLQQTASKLRSQTLTALPPKTAKGEKKSPGGVIYTAYSRLHSKIQLKDEQEGLTTGIRTIGPTTVEAAVITTA